MGQCACTSGGSRSKLKREQIEDLLTVTKFTKQEIVEWYDAFRHVVPSGRMTYHVYQQLVLKAVFRRGPEKMGLSGEKVIHHLDLSFRQYDVDGDHTISFREFLIGMSISTKGTLSEKICWAFSLYDIDKDGLISLKEMHEILMLVERAYGTDRTKEESSKFVEFLFKFLDADHNGFISVQEFIAGLKSKPELFDFFTGASDALSAFKIDDLKEMDVQEE